MANVRDKCLQAWKETRGNLAVEGLKALGGSSVLSAIWKAISQAYHHAPVDWALFSCLVIFGVFLVVLALVVSPRMQVQISPKSNPLSKETEEIQHLKQSLSDSAKFNLECRAERDQCEEDKRELKKRLHDMFTPLQLEAIELSKELGDFMKRIGDRPSVPPGAGFDGIFYDSVRGQGYKWGIKMQAAYEAEMSPKVNAFISHLELETGRLNTRLRNYKDHVHDFESINTIRAQLWLEVMYQLDIDFTGER